jgi:23S rRNA pseudouridine1911/1915/1917 synthase
MKQYFSTLTADACDAGQRVDRFLAERLTDLSRARILALMRAGEVTRDGVQITEASDRVKPGQRFTVHLPAPQPARPQPEPLPLDVVFEDEHLVVLEKPAGLVVHPAAGHASGTLVNALLAHCDGSLSGIGGVARPGIVHRLDKDVSGVMVVAKHDRAHVRLAAQFSVHTVLRVYQAIVLGMPPAPAGSIDAPIGRHPRERKRMAVVPTGKRALTRYRMLRSAGGAVSWLALELATGRTHQIRVHLQSLGLAIAGDPIYRPRRMPKLGGTGLEAMRRFGRIALHAETLGFDHPITGQRLLFERPSPASFHELFAALALAAG